MKNEPRPGKVDNSAGPIYVFRYLTVEDYSQRKSGVASMLPEHEQIFDSFYDEYFEIMVAHAFRFTKDWHLANDVAQDAFAKLLEPKKMSEFLASVNRVGWMKNVVMNTARNAIKSRNRERRRLIAYEELFEEPSSLDHYPSEDGDTIRRFKGKLKKEELYLLKRTILDNVSYTELAEELGISVWACYKRRQAIRDKLREEIEKDNL